MRKSIYPNLLGQRIVATMALFSTGVSPVDDAPYLTQSMLNGVVRMFEEKSHYYADVDHWSFKIGPYVQGMPLCIVVPGGGWLPSSMESPNLEGFAGVMASKGVVTATIQYRGFEGNPPRAAVADLRLAVRHILERVQPSRYFLVGTSAGAEIVMSAVQTNRDGEVIPIPDAVGLFYGAFSNDRALWLEPTGSNLLVRYDAYHGGAAELWQPARNVWKLADDPKTPHWYIMHGRHDNLLSPAHSLRLVDQLKRHKLWSDRSVLNLDNSAGHAEPIAKYGDAFSVVALNLA